MTADEIIEKHYNMDKDEDGNKIFYFWSVKQAMIEFARIKVKQALEAASEKAYVEFVNFQDNEIFDYSDVLNDDDIGANVNKDSILNAYPESNIV